MGPPSESIREDIIINLPVARKQERFDGAARAPLREFRGRKVPRAKTEPKARGLARRKEALGTVYGRPRFSPGDMSGADYMVLYDC